MRVLWPGILPFFDRTASTGLRLSLTVSFGRGNMAAITHTKREEWPEFAQWLVKTPAEARDKAEWGWYIPAEFNPVYRDSENFVARHAITFDFDRVTADVWGDACHVWAGLAFAIYTTFSHRPETPRFRVVMPLSRPAGFDEFQAVARRVAVDVGIDFVAAESFVPAQMMFVPLRPLGGAFTSLINEGDLLDVDAVLSEYEDWTDVSSWPRRRDGDAVHAMSAEKIDPREKPGVIGEFNRAYTISQAIEKFQLPYRRVR